MRISKQPENTGGIICHYNRNFFVIQQRYQAKYEQQQAEYLQVNRRTQELSMTRQIDDTSEVRKFSAFLGIIDFDGEKFLLFCDEARVVSVIDSLEVFEVSSLFFLGYTDEKLLKRRPERKEIYRKIREYYIILKNGFYFSYKYNLTLPLRLQGQQTLAHRFVWNIRFFSDLDKYNLPFRWRCPLIQGFVKSFEVFLEGSKLGYVLISRRSNRKGGTRYFDRGMDEDGFVANFCETEQVVRLEEFVVSDLQIRGSVPLFFEQVGLTTRTKVNRGYELTHQVYRRHIERLTRQYKRVFFANLLSVGKHGERMLTEELEAHIKAEVNPALKYLYYDFHRKVAGGYYEKVDEVIGQIKAQKLNLRYYVSNTKTGAVLEEPSGVFRTNCLDCLDRTNFFQAKLALITLEAILRQFGVCNRDLLAEMRDNNADNDFIRNFRHIWADNGDAISYHYTGTGSTHTDITRDGKRGWLGNFKHKYKTITRFYNQNFWDFYKMRLVGLLLGEAPRDKLSVGKLMKERENEYLVRQTHEIYIFTWKAPKKAPKSLFLFPNTPKIIVVGIQDLSEEDKWNRVIADSIDKERYILVEEKKAYGNMVKIFAARELRAEISLVEHGRLKFSSYYNTVLSNKCANFIRFSLSNTRLVFVGCQLEKGQDLLASRTHNLRDLHEHAFQVEEVGLQRSASILADDVIFLFGNMNTTVAPTFKPDFARFNDLSKFGEEQRKLVSRMMETDEFQQIRESLLEFREYEEEEVTFPPTYRYSGGAFDLDCSGWPDRIWYSSENKINCTRYGVIEEMRGEHVPVIGTFLLEVEKVNNEMKERVCNEIIERQTQSMGIVDFGEEEDSEEIAVKL